MSLADRWLVIGVGNRDRGDDGAGPAVCDQLTQRRPASGDAPGAVVDVPVDVPVDVTVIEGSVLDIPMRWAASDRVVVVDASEPNGQPGRVVEVDGLASRLSWPGTISTHSIDVGAAIELGRALGRMPAELTIIGIEGHDFGFGAPMTREVRLATERVAAMISRRAASRPGEASFDGAS